MLESCWEVLRPPPDEPMLLWCIKNLRTWDDRKWDHALSPHAGAPGGPMEAFQDPGVREIFLMWASRLAKTNFGLAALFWISAVWPAPIMFASATRQLVEDVLGDRAWKMAELSSCFGNLPPEGRRQKKKLRLPRCRWDSGWAENPRTLADKSIKILHCNEVDKWRHLSGTKEADPYDLATERTKEWPDRKIIVESTPTIKKQSRIESGFENGWGCHYYVPCPLCLRWQRLVKGEGGPGGMAWDSGPGGRSIPSVAEHTARYICLHCKGELNNDVRPWMMRRGVWVPFGCTVDHDAAAKLFDGIPEGVTHHREDLPPAERTYRWRGWANAPWVRGTPLRDGSRASFQLSTIYSLNSSWGEVAKVFIEAQRQPAKLQNFINSWLGETFATKKQIEEWETLARRMIGQTSHRTVPVDCSLVTMGIDRQKDHFVFVALAWSPGRRPFVIDYGTPTDYDELKDLLLDRFHHADGGPPVPVTRAMIDVNFHPVEEDGSTVYHFCRKVEQEARRRGLPLFIKPCRGANRPLNRPYKHNPDLGKDTNCPGAELFEICPSHTQSWIEKRLYYQKPEKVATVAASPSADPGVVVALAQQMETDEDRGGIGLYAADAYVHEDYIKQLMNDSPSEHLDKHNHPVTTWERIDKDTPNDYRDATRYGFAAMLHAVRNAAIPTRTAMRAQASAPIKPATGGGMKTPDGRNWFVLNRR